MANAGELADALDHPVFFLIVVAIGVAALLCIFTWLAKAANLQGLASVLEH
jgi:hypothetical protein